ncbi:FAD binding domain protein [Polyplosphaeria fusca]|uniref:FAD binding domain protein n=1 Tax=Polyplosphaeria fusca TaxID=682080 RepID=A0A9P4UX35_9PLEO|nr:FAD binding domain protein [Polyplosphaeria fusca]
MRTHRAFLSILFAVQYAELGTSAQTCKCVPGEDCWPSRPELDLLNSTVKGNLIQGVPPASVCYLAQPNYDTQQCDTVIASWFDPYFHANDPISIDYPWWNNNSCPPIFANGTSVTGDANAGAKGCHIGDHPVYAVNATSEEAVIAAVQFASKHNIRLNVKSTGHSLLGRSTAFGSLSVWTHHSRGIKWHEDFQPDSCTSGAAQRAVTLAAGERTRDVYEAAAKRNLVVSGSAARDIGIVGWFTGGGHGPLTGDYGLGADNIIEARIVTPDGQLRVVNSCQNSDLFWAIRGGGGGTFGVVTQVTMKAYPAPNVTRHTFSLTTTDPSDEVGFWNSVANVWSYLPSLRSGGLQGYGGISQSASSRSMTWSFNLYGGTSGAIEKLIEPIIKYLDPKNGTSLIYKSGIASYPDFFTLWNSTASVDLVANTGSIFGSRLLPAESFTTDLSRLAGALKNATAPGLNNRPSGLGLFMVAPQSSSNNTSADISATPAWRDAILHMGVSVPFSDALSFTEAQPYLDEMTYKRVEALKTLAPDSGAYLNEADPFDPDWQASFWGQNYERLARIKKTYDPDGLLWCVSCVGSERWARTKSGQLCRVEGVEG